MKKSSVGNAAYKAAGVDIEAGDNFSSFCGNICRSTYRNSPFVKIFDWAEGNFRGPRGWKFGGVPAGTISTAGADGIGTGVIIISEADAHYHAASRLMAMTGGDITRWGGLPLLFLNILDTAGLGEPGSEKYKKHQNLMLGLADYAAKQNIVLFSGETAEMGDCVKSENPNALTKFNWGAVMIGAMHKSKLINGCDLAPGQSIIALRDGWRSNGGSMLRKGFQKKYGREWWKNPLAATTIADAARPAALYDRFLSAVNGWYEPGFRGLIKVHAIAHLSGGGIGDKFGEGILFPRGLSATLTNLWGLPSVVQDCAEVMRMSDEEVYSTFNGGQGVLVVVDKKDENLFISLAKDAGFSARVAGKIVSSSVSPMIEITSRFSGKVFPIYPKPEKKK